MTDSINSKKRSGIPHGRSSINKEHAMSVVSLKNHKKAAAGLPAVAGPITAAPLAISDPIFAAIERHRAAFMRQMAKDQVHSNMPSTGPDYREDEYTATSLASSEAGATAAAAANKLTKLPPTTMAGVLALIEYVEAFNARGLALPDDPHNWSSCPMAWPENMDKNGIDLFGYSVLANVRRALESLAVQS